LGTSTSSHGRFRTYLGRPRSPPCTGTLTGASCRPAPSRPTSGQATAYVAWLAERSAHHGDAFADLVGAEGAVTAWRHLITTRASPSKVNQALAAVTLMYQQTGLRIAVKRARIPRPGEPGALTPEEEGAVRRAAARRAAAGPRRRRGSRRRG
jgi:hypothetical protein